MTTPAGSHAIAAVEHPIAAALRAEVVAFWMAHGAIPSADEARRRADELVCIARDALGEIAGVNTAALSPPGPDGRRWFAYRMFVRRQDRQLRLSLAMVRAAVQELRRRRGEPSVAGVVIVTENRKLMKRGGHRLLQRLGFARAGRDRRGQEVWMCAFDAPAG